MQIATIHKDYNQSFGINFKLSETTVKTVRQLTNRFYFVLEILGVMCVLY